MKNDTDQLPHELFTEQEIDALVNAETKLILIASLFIVVIITIIILVIIIDF